MTWLVLTCAVLGGLVVPTDASSQVAVSGDVEVRVVARRVVDGRVEFGLRQRLADGQWGEVNLPPRRFFPTTAAVGRWLQSSPLTLGAPQVSDLAVRVVARRVADGRVEFGLRQRLFDDSWGEIQLPSRRFFPTTAAVGRWLQSSPLTLTTPVPADGEPVAPTDSETDTPTQEFVSVAVGDDELACGLRAGGSVRCWGRELAGFSPRGQFSTLSAGARQVCGVRVEGTIECWGHGAVAASPPPGRFIGVGAGEEAVCGIHADRRLECWGSDGETWWQPEGRFRMVEVPIWGNACALRTDGTVVCTRSWSESLISPLDGEFTTISSAEHYVCGVRFGGELACWGYLSLPSGPGAEGTDRLTWLPPQGQFVDVVASQTFGCAVRADGEVVCWGNESGCFGEPALDYVCGGWAHDPLPAGPFTQIDTGPAVWGGPGQVCAVRPDGPVVCWNDGSGNLARRPSGRFTTVDASALCGTRVGGEFVCWGRDGEHVMADGPFTATAGNSLYGCGLQPDGEVTCWGLNSYWPAVPPTPAEPGPFTAIYVHWQRACGLRPDGEAVCWGTNNRGQSDPLPGRFSTLDLFSTLSCGLRPDGDVECWGAGSPLNSDAPSGPFTAVKTQGTRVVCGLRPDGETVCWGREDRIPEDASRVFAEPDAPDVIEDPRWRDSYPGGSFVTIDVAGWRACGIRYTGHVVCWSPAWPPATITFDQ